MIRAGRDVLFGVLIALGTLMVAACDQGHEPLGSPAERYVSNDGKWWIEFNDTDTIPDAQLPLFDDGVDEVAACDAGDRGRARRFSARWDQWDYHVTIWVPNGRASGTELLLHAADDWSDLTYQPCGPDVGRWIVLRPASIPSS